MEPHNLALEPSTVTTPPGCKSESPLTDNSDEDEEEEDQTVFFTPELFEEEDKEGSPQRDLKAESPSRMESSTLLSERLQDSENIEEHKAILVSKESTEVSQEQNEEIIEQKQGEEGQQVDTQSRQTHNRLCRLSRSKQTGPSTSPGN